MAVIYTTPEVTSTGGRDGGIRSADGLIDVQVASPPEMGGPGGKTNPEELFAAGYAACFHGALKYVAGQQKVGLGASSVQTKVGLGPNDHGKGFAIEVDILAVLPSTEPEAAKAIVHEAHEVCPYSNATRNNVPVRVKVQAKDGAVYDVA